jgi:hypothetical protein
LIILTGIDVLAALRKSGTTGSSESRDEGLEQIFGDISAEIDHLNKMTNSIHRGNRDSQNSGRINDGDDVEAFLLTQFVSDQFPDASVTLQQRLARTMLLRRRRIMYRRHRQAESAMLNPMANFESPSIPPAAGKTDPSIKTEPQEGDRKSLMASATIPAALESTNLSTMIHGIPKMATLPNIYHPSHSNQIAKSTYEQLMLQWSTVDLVLLDDLDNKGLGKSPTRLRLIIPDMATDNLASAGTQVWRILGTDSQARLETPCPYCLYDLPSAELFGGHKW